MVQRWLTRAREIAHTVQAADSTVSTGEESLRFNHRARAEFERLQRIGEAQLASSTLCPRRAAWSARCWR